MRHVPLLLLVVALAAFGGRLATGSGGSSSSGARSAARVVRVVDGDTLRVRAGGREAYVRVIGIDTPESKRPGVPVECGAHAAARAMARLVHPGSRVTLVGDPTQDGIDRYGRMLRYVQLPGGRDVGEAQVRRGWAEVYVYDHHPFQRVGRYERAAAAAERARRGVDGRCGGDFHSAQ